MDNNKKLIESLKSLSQTTRILNQPLQQGELISTMLDESIKLSGADLVSLVLLNHGRTPTHIYVMSSESKKKMSLSPGEFELTGEDKDLDFPHHMEPDDPWNQYLQKHVNQKYTCRLRLPLFFKDKRSGYLDLYSSSEPCFSENNLVDYLKALADNFSMVFENARLNEFAQKKILENKILIESSRMLANVLERDEVIAAIAEGLKTVVDYDGISIYLFRDKENLNAIFWKGYKEDDCKTVLMTKAGEGLVGWVAKSGQGVVVDDVCSDDRYICARDETQSELVVPIKVKDKVLGVFNIESNEVSAYTKHDLELVSTFADKSAIAIERATLYRELVLKKQLDQEVSIARSIQKTFLPRKKLVMKGFDIAGKNISSRQVGGDYYDFIDIEDGQTGLVIADVVGKGIPAALIMASFRASLIAEIRNNYAIRAIMQKVNRLMTESLDQGNFVTAVYGVLDTRSKIFTFSNAGHNPPILFRKDGDIVELTDGGLSLGIDDRAKYDERPISLFEGDILVFFTDGVTEAQSSSGEQFENENLINVVQDNKDKPASEIVRIIAESVRNFKAPDFILDDLTIMMLKVL
jgi:phosphoserine phosphatase RsbU/P